MAKKPEELQQVLHYTFKNPALLRIALTHTSFANESKVATTHNERLEFLGDSVLSVVVADYLFHQSGRPEGELTRMRASLVSEDALFQFAQEIHLGEYLRLGHGEDLGGGRNRPSVVSDAFEAVIAALYLDGGGGAGALALHRPQLFSQQVGLALQYRGHRVDNVIGGRPLGLLRAAAAHQ